MPPDTQAPLEHLKKLLSEVDPKELEQIMPLTGGVITMMFTDVVDSTSITQEVGEQAYFAALDEHNRVIRSCITDCDGHELKTIGDSFFVGFRLPQSAVACAAQIQQALKKSPVTVGGHSLNVRIGLHTGTPEVYRDVVSGRIDLRGNDPNKASRVESIARGGQVLISNETLTLARPQSYYDWGKWELKDLGNNQIFEVLYPGKEPELPKGRVCLEPLRFPTSFVGRVNEVAELVELVKRHREVTVNGMGGSGKTRLADAAARRVSDHFEEGTYFIELAGVSNSESALVSELVAQLEVNTTGFKSEAEALLTSLQNRKALLVLDNFEAVTAAASFVGALFQKCPALHLLVTSQLPLRIDAEKTYDAPLMETPADGSSIEADSLAKLDAFQLFRERARARKVTWDLQSSADAGNVAAILKLTEGIPLSIELAAGWIGSRTLSEIKKGLGKRLATLQRRSPGAPARHNSIEACLKYSFDLLEPREKALFPLLSVFAIGFFAEDVAAVCGASNALASLEVLHERNLLVRQEVLERSRYSMLATVQEFATDKLGVAEGLKERHAEYFLKVLAEADQTLGGRAFGANEC